MAYPDEDKEKVQEDGSVQEGQLLIDGEGE